MLLQRGSAIPILYSPLTTATPTLTSSRPRLHLHLHLHRTLPLSSTPHRPLLSASTSTSTPATEVESLPPLDHTTSGRSDDDYVGEDEELQVKELEDLPEQWRRSKVAWLCKELPSYTHSTFTRILNAQRKWITQDDTSYVLLHFLRIRSNEAAFRVYRWMTRQHWYAFNFALSTKLAECLGRDRRPAKCREVFDDMIACGRIPRESTFHVLVVAYLSSPVDGGLEDACALYNRMIRLGGYRPRLTLHNSLFRAIVSRPGASARHFLEQAEFIFRNLDASGLEIHKDIYTGLIWLHSYRDAVDRGRIEALREMMRGAGFDESRDLLVSIMRACSKEGDLEEGRRTWDRILELHSGIPSQAFVYHMEIYAKIGQPMKALELFRSMGDHALSPNVVAYQKIIEVLSKAGEVETVESLMAEFVESGLKPLSPSYIALMDMYLRLELYGELEQAFSQCNSRCSPNRNVYSLYLDSLVRGKRIEKAEEIFNEMQMNAAIGTSAHSCNIMLGGFLVSDSHEKAEKLYNGMLQKKYVIEPDNFKKMEHVVNLKKKAATKKPPSMKLDIEQREILIGLLLGGLVIESHEQRRSHYILFEFRENSDVHNVLRTHIHERFYEWLRPDGRSNGEENDLPWSFSTISHLHFGFYADQFWPNGRLAIPRLINRWLSERILAYWYMYGGLRTSSGDVVLKLKVVRREDAERVVKYFLTKSLNCKIKRKGKVVWIGFQRQDAIQFWKMVEPYVLETAKEALDPNCKGKRNKMELTFSSSDVESGSDTDEEVSE